MTLDEQTAATRDQLTNAEGQMLRALASAKALASAQEDEIRKLRAEVLQHNDEALTEKQVADILQCDKSSIAKLRKRERIQPSFYLADSMPRYWRSKLPEIFADCKPRKKQKADGRRQAAGKAGNVIQVPESERPTA